MAGSSTGNHGNTPVRRSTRRTKTPQRLQASAMGLWSDDEGQGGGDADTGTGRSAADAMQSPPHVRRKRRDSYSAVTGKRSSLPSFGLALACVLAAAIVVQPL